MDVNISMVELGTVIRWPCVVFAYKKYIGKSKAVKYQNNKF